MINAVVALVLLFLAPSEHHRFGLTEPMPRPDGTIRVATYNMLNFFDQKNDRSLEGEYDDFGDNPGPTSSARCEELAKVIRAIDADDHLGFTPLQLPDVEFIDPAFAKA